MLHPSKLLSIETALVVVARLSTRLGLARPTLELLLTRLMMPRRSPVLSRYEPTEHDVFVATFAKSGTNWAMQICQQIAHRGAAEFDHIHHVVAWPEVPYSGVVPLDDPAPLRASPTGRRVIKTHLPAEGVPYEAAARYVTIIRDPKDVMVSAYYFVLGLLGIRDRVDPRQWLDLCFDSDTIGRRWAEHTAGFWRWRDRPNVLVRTFGEVRADLPGTVDTIAALMGVELTEPERAAVLERSSFRYMQAHDDRFGPPRSPLVSPTQHPKMVRRGQSGSADELFDARQRAFIDDRCRRMLRALGSDFPYDERFGGR